MNLSVSSHGRDHVICGVISHAVRVTVADRLDDLEESLMVVVLELARAIAKTRVPPLVCRETFGVVRSESLE